MRLDTLPHRKMARVGDLLYYAADDGINGVELWRSDGTAEGTSLVADIMPGPKGSGPDKLIEMNGALIFTAADEMHNTEPWIIESR